MGRGADGGDKQPHRHEELVNLDPKNLWCIQGKRYDLRQHGFLDKHPGTFAAPARFSSRPPTIHAVLLCSPLPLSLARRRRAAPPGAVSRA